MTVNTNVSNLGIVTASGSYYKGNNTWKRMSVGTTYEFKYNSAFTIDNQSLDLIVTLKPVEKASGGLVDIRLDSNNKMELWNEKTNVDISYKIVKHGTNTTITRYFVYGFGDADGADYIFTTTDKDIYYKTGAKLGGTAEFPDYYSIYTTGTQGIKRPSVNTSTDYDEAAIYVGCNGASEFSLSWQTKGSTTNDF